MREVSEEELFIKLGGGKSGGSFNEEEEEVEEGEEEGEEVSEEEYEEYMEEFISKIKKGGDGTPKDFFKKVDRRPKNGKISKKEIYIYAKKMLLTKKQISVIFKVIDPDGDGEVTEEEVYEKLGGCKKCGDNFKEEEGEGEGEEVSEEEYFEEFKNKLKGGGGTPKDFFKKVDRRPKNGKISRKEIIIYGKKMKMTKKQITIFYKIIDPDGDGEVSEEEVYEKLGGCKSCGDKYAVGEEEEEIEVGEGEGEEEEEEEEIEIGGSKGKVTEVSPDACKCPKVEEELIIDEENGDCSYSKSGMMAVALVGAKSKAPACELNYEPPKGKPPVSADAPWRARIWTNIVKLTPEKRTSRKLSYFIEEGVFKDTCGRKTAAIECSREGSKKKLTLSTWGFF